ncbi:hypothetical protein BZA77DRAFT_361599 [Pyronema omphalodes]|nr:hypothetical protein BZA77DRAFT_361599 [Pyronema omphalodes]
MSYFKLATCTCAPAAANTNCHKRKASAKFYQNTNKQPDPGNKEEEWMTISPNNSPTIEKHPQVTEIERDNGNFMTDILHKADNHKYASYESDDSGYDSDSDDQSVSSVRPPERRVSKNQHTAITGGSRLDFAVDCETMTPWLPQNKRSGNLSYHSGVLSHQGVLYVCFFLMCSWFLYS